MKLASVLSEVKNKQFNCSKGAELLADQPTKDEESHAHVHSLDPFKVDVSKIKPEGFKAPSGPVFATVNPAFTSVVQERKKFWENPELHLHPEASHPHKSQLYDGSSAPSSLKLVERSPQTVKVDTSDKQPKVVTEGALYDKVEMKRVVLVIKKNALGDLVVVTCYPSQNHPAVKPQTPPPAPEDDVVELDKATDTYRVLKQVGAIELKW